MLLCEVAGLLRYEARVAYRGAEDVGPVLVALLVSRRHDQGCRVL